MGKKNTETAESGKKERGCIFFCARLNVHDHVHLMKKQERKTEKTKAKPQRKQKSSVCIQSVLSKDSLTCFKLHMWPDVVCVPLRSCFSHSPWSHTWKLHTLVVLWEKSAQQVRTSAESDGTFCSSLFSQSLMELSSGAQAGTSQQPLAPQLHPFDCLLLLVCFYCLRLQCINKTWANRQLVGPLVGALFLFGWSPECCDH